MLRDIHIQNFRCFQDTKVSVFGDVNLITGKNNSGKTALLEALYLAVSPHPRKINNLMSFRQESVEFCRKFPEMSWNNLFFNQDKSNEIHIGSNSFVEEQIFKDLTTIYVNSEYYISFDRKEMRKDFDYSGSDLSDSANNASYLKIESSRDGNQGDEYSIVSTDDGFLNRTYRETANRQDFLITQINLIPSAFPQRSGNLAIGYDKARLNHKEKEVLRGFQIIDPLIRSAETLSIGIPTLYLAREGQKRLPISLFGDAINRVANIILCIIDKVDGVLLIDEIENGIHHANQSEIWRMIFRLAKEFNVQIFATTHSLEMLEAFGKVGLENEEFKQMDAHFEMSRKLSSNRIIGIRRDVEILEFSLDRGIGVRGE
jgi:AAA15 family ATPase/GTPase